MNDTGEIKVFGNDLERAIRLLASWFAQNGLSRELRRRTFFESRSQKKRRKIRENLRTRKKRELKEHNRESVDSKRTWPRRGTELTFS